MSTTQQDASPAPFRPLARHTQLEVDQFCDACSYNLHGQLVTRDERLGILVVRCPECGDWHPAGRGTSAVYPWLARLAVWLLGIWVFVAIAATLGILFGFGALQVGHVETFSYGGDMTADGRPLTYARDKTGSFSLVLFGSDTPYTGPVHYAHTLTPPPTRDVDTLPGWGMFAAFVAGSVSLGFLAGFLLVVALWHWRKSRYPWAMLMPLLPAAFVSCVFVGVDEYQLTRAWSISRAMGEASVQAIGIGLGILAGRPIARVIVKMLVPPKPRQLLTFLWRADGKTPPGTL